jgi:hypothetical protein
MITHVRVWVANLVRVIDMEVSLHPFRLKRRNGLWVQPEVSPAADLSIAGRRARAEAVLTSAPVRG